MNVRRVLILGTLALALVGYGATWAVADDGDERVAIQPALVLPTAVAGSEPPTTTPGWTTAISAGGDPSLNRMERRNAAAALGIGPSQPMQPTMQRQENGTSSMQAKCRFRVYRMLDLPRVTRYNVLSRCNSTGY